MSNKEQLSNSNSPSTKRWGWSEWILLILIFVASKFAGLVGGLAVGGLWYLIAFLIKKVDHESLHDL